MICRIILKPNNEEIKAEKGTFLSEALKDYTEFECGGHGLCGKCKVKVTGSLSPLKETEKNLPKGYRLACQTRILGDCEVFISKTIKENQILTENFLRDTELTKKGFGIAFDIGTTTIAAYILDLEKGKIINSVSCMNPQITYGSDVISRIDYLNRHPEAKHIFQSETVNACNKLIYNLIKKTSVDKEKITALSFVGNTCMHHIFMGIDTESLGTLPYNPKITEKQEITGKDLGLDINAKAFVFPNIARFVGGDTVGAILSCMPKDTGKTLMLLDIGTNGECALRHRGKLFVCSAAAGPAFEGGNISCGMGGSAGAIDRVWEEKGKIKFHVIGDTEPKGICGSGITDYINILLKLGYINRNGRIIKDIPNLSEHINLSQKDIREFQLAKGSLSAALKTLSDTAEINENDIDKIYLAGGFGNYINKESAKNIGLLPNISSEKIISIGNGAAAGALLALLNKKEWQQTEIIQKEAIHIKLEESDIYKNLLIDCLSF